ncbi:MAG TPA: endonuclease Q family protein [Pseudogracilibacillus sp.]|nr:endonuclease Q family protein [Pseudogracilibacillus sp.]
MLTNIFADLHIHIGRDYKGNHVKISASYQLTLKNILIEASRSKGIELIGVIDCHVPNVLYELKQLVNREKAKELAKGGIRFEDVTLLLGSELEIYDNLSQGPFHVLVFLPTIEAMEDFSAWLEDKMTNIHLSSQRIYCTAKALQDKTKQLGGLFIPAHVFTPFKSLYGSGVKNSLSEVLDPEKIDAIELGLSSDTTMADQIAELHCYPFLTNSDSHSLQKIGREYQQLAVEEASFTEFSLCLQSIDGRKIIKNFGMNPHLGKYYRTVCQHCYQAVELGTKQCPACHSKRIIAGVKDRIDQLQSEVKIEEERPAYIYQVPLEYIPGLGPKTLDKLLAAFHTEMNIVHRVSYEELRKIIPKKIAQSIIHMREGSLTIASGGGGKYGRVIK